MIERMSFPYALLFANCESTIRSVLTGLFLCCLPVSAQVSPYAGKIQHVIVIIQENHSFDHYFGHLPGIPGNPVTTGQVAGTGLITLKHFDPTVNHPDLPHTYLNSVTAIDNGAMDRFPYDWGAYSYYDCGDLPFYCGMATTFGLATNYWPQRGPSYPAHLGFIAAPIDVVDNPNTPLNQNRWTCFASQVNGTVCKAPGCIYGTPYGHVVNDIANYPANTSTTMYHAGICIDHQGVACTSANAATVCADHGGSCDLSQCQANTQGCICPSVTTVGSNLSKAGVTHRWYGPGAHNSGAFWEAPYYEQAAAFGSESINMANSTQYMTDVSNNNLPLISWISPSRELSEHPDATLAGATVANGAAQTEAFISQCFTYHANCYDHALILLLWDDNGGYYDHVAPSSTQDGVRVPLICIGPYCKQGFNSTYLTQAGVLKCVEDIAGIAYIGPLDTNAESICAGNGSAMINLSQAPIPVPTGHMVASLKATRSNRDNPDVVDAVTWLWHKLHPDHDEKEVPPLASLKQRPCDPAAPLRDWATFAPTGEQMEFCHDRDNKYILFPGQTLDDADDADEQPQRKGSK